MINRYRNEVRAILTDAFGKIEIVELPYAPTRQIMEGMLRDATGVYTNILHTASAAYVPAFGLPEDEEAIGIIEAHCDRPVIRVPMGKVAQMGGAIRCLTWQNRCGMTDVPLGEAPVCLLQGRCRQRMCPPSRYGRLARSRNGCQARGGGPRARCPCHEE